MKGADVLRVQDYLRHAPTLTLPRKRGGGNGGKPSPASAGEGI